MQGAAFSLLRSNVLPIISRPEIMAPFVQLFQSLNDTLCTNKKGIKVRMVFDSVITKTYIFIAQI